MAKPMPGFEPRTFGVLGSNATIVPPGQPSSVASIYLVIRD